jgi:hypothetical protein
MDRDKIESDIRLLDVRVLEIVALVAQQQHVIATLERIGRDTRAANDALAELLAVQRHRGRIGSSPEAASPSGITGAVPFLEVHADGPQRA